MTKYQLEVAKYLEDGGTLLFTFSGLRYKNKTLRYETVNALKRHYMERMEMVTARPLLHDGTPSRFLKSHVLLSEHVPALIENSAEIKYRKVFMDRAIF